ncbi:MAG: aminodeoxychorismate/anthranilate synthase component II [Deltaproteobacteria bacterium]|nr:aminodeoxychorismate/anthranilate synthase component II [Deltaproteobacteria bacterium]MBN2672552.1 aminodeoxychorismate/anthranilate synthase component II [Deltaproteobacteria bacterium]
MSGEKLNVLFIDNFDSFVFNLVDEFEKRDCAVQVWRNDIGVEKVLDIYEKMNGPKLIVLSPGPGTPTDAGCCVELVRQTTDIPIFGVCLGQQSITEACDGKVVQAGEIVHGKSSMLQIDADSDMFKGLPDPLSVGRYHSLICEVDETQFDITAKLGDMVMAIEHKTRPLKGVQFHPESVLTPEGGTIVENIMAWATALHANR